MVQQVHSWVYTKKRKSVLGVHWKDWCWRWISNTLATWFEELTHLKRSWFWERLRAGGEGGDRGWDGWMASLTQWTWVWVESGSWWWTGSPSMLRFMGSQSRTRLNDWTELKLSVYIVQQEKYNQYFVVVVQSLSHVWLCDPMDCRMTGFPVFHCLLEFAQTHILWINNSIQLSYPLSPSSPPALNLSLYQGLSHWVSYLHQVVNIFEFQLQYFQWIFRVDFL